MQHPQRPSSDQVTGVSIPTEAGTYVLVLHLAALAVLNMGRLGTYTLPEGDYAYIGSAHGPGGLRARVGRHVRGTGTRHWHVDALRRCATVKAVIYTASEERLECAWAQALARLPSAETPICGFGSSDCKSRCGSHLIALPRGVTAWDLRQVLSDVLTR